MYNLTGKRGLYGLFPTQFKRCKNIRENPEELERYKTGFGKDGVGFECKPENFKTGTVTLREAQKFIADIVSNDKQAGCDMIGFILSTHGGYHSSNEELELTFSCGNTCPIDKLLEEIIPKY